jgi:hypothetical protein
VIGFTVITDMQLEGFFNLRRFFPAFLRQLLVGILDFTGRFPVETHNRVNFTVLFVYDLIVD